MIAGAGELGDRAPAPQESDFRGGAGGRKVRTPQGNAPGNARGCWPRGQCYGKYHREYTAGAPVSVADQRETFERHFKGGAAVRVKRWGKGPPLAW
jgi:hypothetical protein